MTLNNSLNQAYSMLQHFKYGKEIVQTTKT